MSHANDVLSLFKTLGLAAELNSKAASAITVATPIDGSQLARVAVHSAAEVDGALNAAQQRFLEWRNVPAPKRGELVLSLIHI